MRPKSPMRCRSKSTGGSVAEGEGIVDVAAGAAARTGTAKVARAAETAATVMNRFMLAASIPRSSWLFERRPFGVEFFGPLVEVGLQTCQALAHQDAMFRIPAA